MGRPVGKKRKVAASNDGLRQKALGPAAEQFGTELAKLEAGRTAAQIVHHALRTVGAVVYCGSVVCEWLQHRLAEKIKDVPPEKLTSPDPRIAAPAIQALTYSMDDETIREMYANLLATEMQVDRKQHSHPAFVELIKQMTPSDARLLEIFRKNGSQIRFRAQVKDGGKSRDVGLGYSFDFDNDPAKNLDNLERLALVERRVMEWPVMRNLESIEKEVRASYGEIQKMLKDPELRKTNRLSDAASFVLKKEGLYLTAFGVSFVQACLPKASPSSAAVSR